MVSYSWYYKCKVTNLVGVIANLQTATRNLQRTTNEATNAGTEVDAVADYVLTSGSKCGPQTITGMCWHNVALVIIDTLKLKAEISFELNFWGSEICQI